MGAPAVQCVGVLLWLMMRAEGRQNHARHLPGFMFQAYFTCSHKIQAWFNLTLRVQMGLGSRQGSSTDGIFTDADSSLGEPVPASSATVEVGDEPSSWTEEEESQAIPVRPTELSFDLPSQRGQLSRRGGRSRRQPRGKVQRGRVRPQNFTGGHSAEGCSDSTCPQRGMSV